MTGSTANHLRPLGRGPSASPRSRIEARLRQVLQDLHAAGREINAAKARLAVAQHEYADARAEALRIWTEAELLAARIPPAPEAGE